MRQSGALEARNASAVSGVAPGLPRLRQQNSVWAGRPIEQNWTRPHQKGQGDSDLSQLNQPRNSTLARRTFCKRVMQQTESSRAGLPFASTEANMQTMPIGRRTKILVCLAPGLGWNSDLVALS